MSSAKPPRSRTSSGSSRGRDAGGRAEGGHRSAAPYAPSASASSYTMSSAPGTVSGTAPGRKAHTPRPATPAPSSPTPSSSRAAAAVAAASGRTDGHPGGPGSAAGHGNSGGGRRPLLFGLHAVAAAWINPERQCRQLYLTEAAEDALAPALAEARARGLERPSPVRLDKTELQRRLPPGTVHQGVALEAAPLPEVMLDDLLRENDAATAAATTAEDAPIIVLDQVTDPHNVGAILRSAAAFGARAVLVTERHAPEVTGVLAKSASGALEVVPLVRVTNLARAMSDLQKAGYWCVGLSESGQAPLPELDLSGRIALVLGAEGTGLRRLTAERCDHLASLPTAGPIRALNVSNAAAVALYELARRRLPSTTGQGGAG